MTVMIKLRLSSEAAVMPRVREIEGLKDLTLDSNYGVVCISPKEGLYVVRADAVDNLEHRKKISPEIVEAYGDVRISTSRVPRNHIM